MAISLTLIPVSLPGDGRIPTRTILRDIVAAFLTDEWPLVDPEALTASWHTSFANYDCTLERPKPNLATSTTEPQKVFIKFHKKHTAVDADVFKHLIPTKQEEALLCHEYSRSGLGAEVHGFFQTQDGTLGRVEQFLDARNMEPEDVENSIVRADVARALAAFHAMEMPLLLEEKAVPMGPHAFYEALTNGIKKYLGMDKVKGLGREAGVNMDELIDYDFGPRLKKVVEKLESVGAKKGWCIHDVQFMNVLVRNHPRPRESTIFLVDFEFAMRNYRAVDIGGHFMQKMFKWFDEETKIADCRRYAEDEKRHFCEEYAAGWNELTGDSDTGEQVFAEAEYGYMVAIAFDVHNMLCYISSEDDRDPSNLRALSKLFKEFVDQYARLGIDESR